MDLLRFLLDTNIVIPAEPATSDDIKESAPVVAELLATLARGRHSWVIHPGTHEDIERDADDTRRAFTRMHIAKYDVLTSPPPLSDEIAAALGTPIPGSNDHIDLLLLSALKADRADYIVTNDARMRKRAKRIGLGQRVLSAAEALAAVRALFPTIPLPPPLVKSIKAHELADTDPIFQSLREEYSPGFDDWLAKCKRQERLAWIVARDDGYAGICIINEEAKPEFDLRGRVLKLCTFKISERHRGFRYGELLLKTLFGYLAKNKFDSVFVEVFPHHEELCSLLTDFGFDDRAVIARGQHVFAKALKPPPGAQALLGPYDFHVKYGPGNLLLDGATVFVVPIQPRYHQLLFPEAEPQQSLVHGNHPFGNSLRKAYLCHASSRRLKSGDVVLFYRSGDQRAVTVVCVVEDTLVSESAAELARFVGKRTVYDFEQIRQMAAKPVLAILFRLDRILDNAWPLDLLKRSGVVRGHPQSISTVSENGKAWLTHQISVLH